MSRSRSVVGRTSKEAASGEHQSTATNEDRIQQGLRSSGRSLDPALRASLEWRLGTQLSRGDVTARPAPEPALPSRPLSVPESDLHEREAEANGIARALAAPEPRGREAGGLRYDLSAVRIHTDTAAAESASALDAAAYAVGRDIVFAPQRFAPATPAGRLLLGHELAHVLQQAGGAASPVATTAPGALQRATPAEADAMAPAAEAAPTPARALIVEDESPSLEPGQMRKTAFLELLRQESCAAADEALARVGRSTQGCPFVEQVIGRYGGRSSAYLERALVKYAPETRSATNAREYLRPVAAQIGRGVERWTTTGEMPAVDPELQADFSATALAGQAAALASNAVAGLGRMLFLRDPGARANPSAPRTPPARGPGQALDPVARGRMEPAFGFDFSHVRVHSDPQAAAAVDRLDARAVTVGSHIAFGGDQYRPGDPAGDALLAHELAHVVQQHDEGGMGSAGSPPAIDDAPLEREADRAATAVALSLWAPPGGSGAAETSPLPRSGRRLVERLRRPLSLQRCSKSSTPTATPKQLAQSAHAALAATPIDTAALFKALETPARDPVQVAAVTAAYKTDFGTDLEADAVAKLKGDDLARARFLLNAPAPATGTTTTTTVEKVGTEKHKAKVGAGEVSVKTDVDYAGIYKQGYSVGYSGGDSSDARFIQFIWSEVAATQPDGTSPLVAKSGLPTANGSMELTTDLTKPKYKVDSGSTTSPFYEAGGTANRTATGTTIYDRPSEFADVITKQFDAGATKVVEKDHFDIFLITGYKAIYRVSMVVQWVYTSKTAVTRTTAFSSGTAVAGLPKEIKDQLVKEYPKFEYVQ